ncbi:MAG: geranylgeranyl reductase family protein [Bacteroidota bacterium]
MSYHEYDLLIAGAGPAGCTLALNMAGKGLRIAVIEKDVFPRHKICGDALSGKVLNVMKRLPSGIYDDFLRHVPKIPSWGIRFTAPNLHSVDIPFISARNPEMEPPGYVCRRDDFDSFLFEKLRDFSDIDVFEGEPITHAAITPGNAIVKTATHEFCGRVIAGADGVHSTVRKILDGTAVDKKHFCIGIRAYYEHVTGLNPDGFIELLFLRELLPGYFWIFPSANGLVNAGFGMMQNQVVKRKENLTIVFDDLINTHPLLAPRFKNAKIVGKAQAHILPLGTYRQRPSGNRYLLLGDAAFLVDPFSGEGIGNAMASGEIAAQVLETCFMQNDFSASSLKAYDARLQRRFYQDFRTTAIMQRLAGSPWLFNMVVDKAIKNKALGELLTAMFTNEDVKKKLTRPGFYAGLIFK